MQITLYKNFSKRKNSTKRPTGGIEAEVNIKRNTSIENPVFLIDGIDLEVNYVSGLGHYYYVDDIVMVTNDLYELHCSQDVLATYKTEILGSKQYVTRSASNYDGDIVDNFYPTKYGPTVTSAFADWNATTGSYVVGIINDDNTGRVRGGVHYYVMTESEMQLLTAFMLGGEYLEGSEALPISVLKALMNPTQYVVSCKVFPLNLNTGGNAPVHFGFWNVGFDAAVPQPNTIVNKSITIPKHPQTETYGNYVNLSPYSNYTLFIPCFGIFNLDPALVAKATTLTIFISFDAITGYGFLEITDNNNVTHVKITAEVASNVSMSQLSYDMVGTAGLVASTATNTIAGNVAGVLGDAGSATALMHSKPTIISSTGSTSSFTGSPELQCEFYTVVDRDDARNGRPLCKSVTLSALSGFTMCQNPSISIDGLGGDKTEIEGYMSSGFYIE